MFDAPAPVFEAPAPVFDAPPPEAEIVNIDGLGAVMVRRVGVRGGGGRVNVRPIVPGRLSPTLRAMCINSPDRVPVRYRSMCVGVSGMYGLGKKKKKKGLKKFVSKAGKAVKNVVKVAAPIVAPVTTGIVNSIIAQNKSKSASAQIDPRYLTDNPMTNTEGGGGGGSGLKLNPTTLLIGVGAAAVLLLALGGKK
jgi:hypothetical protein